MTPDFNAALNDALKYSHTDAATLRTVLASDPEHLTPHSNMRLVAADAHQEAGDEEFAHFLRSSIPLRLDDNGQVLRSTLKLHRLLTTIFQRHQHTFSTQRPQHTFSTEPHPPAGRRLNDPVNEEAAKELERNGREHEAKILRSDVPIRIHGGKVQADFPEYAWPGGNQVVYHTADGGMICPQCRNGRNGSEAAYTPQTDPQWQVVGSDLYDAGPTVPCDHCNKPIVATYGDPDAPEDDQ